MPKSHTNKEQFALLYTVRRRAKVPLITLRSFVTDLVNSFGCVENRIANAVALQSASCKSSSPPSTGISSYVGGIIP